MKKWIKIAGLLLLSLPFAAHAEDFRYTTNNETITITKYIGTNIAVATPDAINGLPVANIGKWAFAFRTNLTSVTIPNSVTRIGEWAFSRCTSLPRVTIPSSVTNIDPSAFELCHSLSVITVDDLNSVYSSTNGILFDKNQTVLVRCLGEKDGSYTIPDSVTRIGERAFLGCTNLTSVTIPNSITNIGEGAFLDCKNLNTITVDDLNSVYSSTNGILFDKNQSTLIQCPGGNAGNYTIPNSVAHIGDAAFGSCASLTGITIPSSVTCIGEAAFFECTSLTGVTLPNSVTNIGEWAFMDCKSLNTITVDDLNCAYSSTNGVLYDKNQTTLIQCLPGKAGSYTIPDSVTRIVERAFSHCTNLTSVTIPNSVSNIGQGAFSDCGLISITIPNSVTCIEDFEFSHCSKLTSVTIPNSVTNIGNRAFVFCTNLTEVYFRGNAPDFDMEDVFRDDDKAIIYRTAGATGWPPVPEPWAGRPTALWDPSANENPVSWKQRFFGGLTNYWPISLL